MTREQWKERLERDEAMRPFIEAFANGKRVQCMDSARGIWYDLDVQANFDSGPSDYRIIEPPKLRPWKPEEVPVNCIVRVKGALWWFVCLGVNTTGMLLRNNEPTWEALLEFYEHSIDGRKTWLPCGVEVK